MRRKLTALALVLVLCMGLIPFATAANTAPIAKNYEFETYRGVSFGGNLGAVDPDGDELNYEVCTEPRKGELVLNPDGSFVYTPAEGKRGRDYFGYRTVDSEGNRSQEATVIIKLNKCKTDVSYVDMAGSKDERAAVMLAESGVFVGECLGGNYYFEPERSLTKSEFLSICLDVTGIDLLSGVVSTGFDDDDEISEIIKPYVATATMQGIVTGSFSDGSRSFSPNSEISRAEAMVILDRSLKLCDVSYIEVDEAVPSWAVQSAANLSARDIVSDTSDCDKPLTRAEAADMLYAAAMLLNSK